MSYIHHIIAVSSVRLCLHTTVFPPLEECILAAGILIIPLRLPALASNV